MRTIEHVGKYPDNSQAFGVVAILENGSGPRLLLRTELDALPVEEKTGLDYASTVRSTNAQGQNVGVMHACGHDLHMTVLLGVAREMASRRSAWHGTLMLIGQPSEETIDGSKVECSMTVSMTGSGGPILLFPSTTRTRCHRVT